MIVIEKIDKFILNNKSDCYTTIINTMFDYDILIKKYENHKNEKAELNPFMLACVYEYDINIIKYIARHKRTDPNEIDVVYGFNAFLLACRNNKNVNIIKYLVNDLKININHVKNDGFNAFLLACKYNTNVKVIKYLVDELKMDAKYKLASGHTGFTLACKYNKNDDVVKYLLDIDGTIEYILNFPFKKIDKYITNRITNINSPIACLWNSYISKDEKILNFVNYLIEIKMYNLINHHSIRIKKLDSIWTYEKIKYVIQYVKYYINIDNTFGYDLTCKFFDSHISDFNMFSKSFNCELTFIVDFDSDFNKNNDSDTQQNNEFEHNNYQSVEYYGSKLIIYDAIETWKFIAMNGKEKSQGLHLLISQPKHIFDVYIKAHYNGILNILDWKIDDVIHLINLMDMYPSKIITMKKIESYIVKNIERYKSIDNHLHYERFIEICDIYHLIKLRVALNNTFYKQNNSDGYHHSDSDNDYNTDDGWVLE